MIANFTSFTRSLIAWTLAVAGIFESSARGQSLSYDVTMDLKAPPSTVAVQFDVGGNANVTVAAASLSGLPQHLIETGVLASPGRSRVVVYSTGSEPIAPTGRLILMLQVATNQVLVNGMLQISNIVGSDANGVATTLQPNFLPLIADMTPARRTPIVLGQSLGLAAKVVDLDGSLQSASFRLDGSVLGNVPASGTLNWLPPSLGVRALTVSAQDNRSDVSVTPPLDLVVYDPGTITNYAAFRDLHFTASEITSGSGNADADPFGSGFNNLLAMFLDMDPGNPDFSREPSFRVEKTTGGVLEGVLTFVRRTALPAGLNWEIRSSTNLVGDTAVPSSQIVQEAIAGGRTRVTARVPVPPDVMGQFLHLSLSLN
jgi:hypothetical protein